MLYMHINKKLALRNSTIVKRRRRAEGNVR